ncbi:MAG: hypothetical protein AAB372_02445 [Patescibacteria group bacterium]
MLPIIWYKFFCDGSSLTLPRECKLRGNFALWGVLYFFFTKTLEKLYLPELALMPVLARPATGHFKTATPVPRRMGLVITPINGTVGGVAYY